jgi:energy-coupling factor transporter ATP-binding protein EcfA2
VIIASRTPRIVARVDDLLGSFPDADSQTASALRAGRPRSAGSGPAYLRYCLDGRPESAGESPEMWMEEADSLDLWRWEDQFLANLNSWVLDREADRLHLHAALVARSEDGLLLVGRKGAGKSTLAAHLVRCGWTYHTDETVAIDVQDPLIASSYPNPISLKRGSWDFFSDLEVVPEGALAPPDLQRAQIPPRALGRVSNGKGVRVRAIVFLSRDDEQEGLVRVEPTESVISMVEETLDLRRVGVPGVRALVELSSQVQSYRCTLEGLGAADALMTKAVKMSPPEPLELVEVPPEASDFTGRQTTTSGSPGGETVWRRGRNSWGWLFADGGIVFSPSSMVMVRLDGSGARAWELVDGTDSVKELASRLGSGKEHDPAGVVEDVSGFLCQLAHAGLLELAGVEGPDS